LRQAWNGENSVSGASARSAAAREELLAIAKIPVLVVYRITLGVAVG
jgi:hypothetical protein